MKHDSSDVSTAAMAHEMKKMAKPSRRGAKRVVDALTVFSKKKRECQIIETKYNSSRIVKLEKKIKKLEERIDEIQEQIYDIRNPGRWD